MNEMTRNTRNIGSLSIFRASKNANGLPGALDGGVSGSKNEKTPMTRDIIPASTRQSEAFLSTLPDWRQNVKPSPAAIHPMVPHTRTQLSGVPTASL